MGPRPVVRLAAAMLASGCAVLGAAGCTQDQPSLPPACTQGEAAIERALAAAPGDVRLEDGTLLSTCVSHARTDAQLTSMGLLLTGVAERLGVQARDERDPEAAVRLGFLAGAVQRGAQRTAGIHLELARRVGGTAVKLEGAGPGVRRALVEGTRAGLDHG